MELPRRLYGEGLEPQVKKINNSCRMSLLTSLKVAMKEEYEEVRRDPVFTHVMAIEENGLRFSGRLVHSFLCKELITCKKHEKWFIFARRPLRFSMQEYHAVTGLKMKDEQSSDVVKWKNDNGFWGQLLKSGRKINLKIIKEEHVEQSNNWSRLDRLRLIYLCVIMGVVMGRDEKVNIPHLYIKLAMDFEKLRMYPWGLHSFDFLLGSIEKTRGKLEQKEGYLMEGFLFAFQIWIMEAIPAFGEICGKQVNANFTGPRCGNWTGCAKCSYEDIISLETLFPEKGILHSVIEFDRDGVVLLASEFLRKSEKKDERVDQIITMIGKTHDWSKHEWRVVEEVENEADAEEVENEAETEIGERSSVAEDVNDTGTNKRKNQDRGAETRKKKLFCQLAATTKTTIDPEMTKFMEALVTTLEEKLTKQMEKLETMVADKMEKMESEITQLKAAFTLDELARKTDQESGPSKSRVDTAPSKKKDGKKKDLNTDDFLINVSRVNLSQSSDIDLQMGTQDYLESCLKGLSQVMADDPLEGLSEPYLALVRVCEEDFEKLTNWQNSRTAIQIGPSLLNMDMADRIMSVSKWIHNHEIDALMFIFRERTTLRRWKPDRVAFMTCVFSDLIRVEYKNFLKGKKKYIMDKLLLNYGKGELPSHGRTSKVWNIDVDRMYVPVWVNRNHWIALCISFMNRHIEVFDCMGRQKYKEVEAFTWLVPRIVKGVQSLKMQKDLTINPYTVSYVPMRGLNRSGSDCGVFTLKHIECHVLGLNLSLVDDDNIKEARIKLLWDLWEAATDPELIERMSKYEPPKCEPSKCIEI